MKTNRVLTPHSRLNYSPLLGKTLSIPLKSRVDVKKIKIIFFIFFNFKMSYLSHELIADN